ncbi:nucleotidyltransferase domain-containing protein [Alkalihalobacterium chitinilyticum]|uniref:Nucleotidyltransferase domain-containing protein n=1 Tax=Alkalihalobacterium chitinilyticum TaxID=2980103 RepID=A0ABT5VIH4_9BACI|nr:nucleotidyltransferase domain-containing protein [Alkalihalobacterium chitinilyticum]MDE5415253.1 nucleotidyltransferase domain-containing protein [Alkalihalobacterium chitinilyticum]
MKEKIKNILSEMEAAHHIKIIYACEAGSRAWGTASSDSDYDVRFIYIHPINWYLSIEQKREVLEFPVTKELDMVGWDLRKALALLNKSNPTLLEWLQSSIVYYEKDEIVNELRLLSHSTFSAKTCLYHYLNMAKRNVKGAFNSPSANVKLVLNVVKPLLACSWIEKNHSIPPNQLQHLMNAELTPSPLRSEIDGLLANKLKKVEEVKTEELIATQEYVAERIVQLSDYIKALEEDKQNFTEALDQFFQTTLGKIWN